MNENKILATVQGTPITEAQVEATIAALGQRGQGYNSPQGKEMILEQLINKKLLVLDAEKNLYEYDPEFKAELAQIKEEMLANFAVKKAVENVSVSDEEAKKEYDSNPDMFKTPETVSASHILVDSEDKAKEILAKIEAKEISFEDAAKENSSCPSGQNGGSLGEFGRGQMVPEFDEACFTMEIGELRGPIKTQFGFHLILLTAKNEAKTMSFEEVKEGLKQQMKGKKQQEAYESKINQLKILYQVDRF